MNADAMSHFRGVQSREYSSFVRCGNVVWNHRTFPLRKVCILIRVSVLILFSAGIRFPLPMTSPKAAQYPAPKACAFTGFVLDLGRGQLLREGQEVKLRPKCF